MKYKLADIFEKPISGEWGEELREGEKGTKVIRTTNFTNLGRLDLNNIVERKIDLEKFQNKVLKLGDIIIEKSGGSPTQPVGRTVIFDVDSNEKYICNNFTAILRPINNVYPKYVLYLLKDLYNRKQVIKFQNKTTGIINLKLNDYLLNTEITLPKLEIQKKIANLLDKSQELIDKRKAQIDVLDVLVKSRFIGMFGEWLSKKKDLYMLSEMCNFIDYRGKTPEKSDEGIPLITAKNVKNHSFSFEPREYIPSENYDDVMTRGIPKANDILFTTEAPLGNVCRIPEIIGKFCVGQRLITMQTLENIVPEYLEYALLSNEFQNEMWKKSSGSTVKGIRSKELVKLSIPVPPLDLQNQFAAFVNQVDKLKFEMEKSLKELEDNFNSLMQKAFNGELFN
jgi:type I restriction enzyme S subunit